VFGHTRDFFRSFFKSDQSIPEGNAPLCKDFEDFYTRRLYRRIQDCFNRPIASAPDAWVDVTERHSNENNKTLFRIGKTHRRLNGSYNYLGFASADEYCTPRVIETPKGFSPQHMQQSCWCWYYCFA